MDAKKFILKAEEIEGMKGETKIHFLNSNAVRLNKSIGDVVGLNHIGVHIVSVEPGRDTTEYHKHYYEEECVYILSGTGMAIIDGDSCSVEKGDFLGFPRNTVAHNIKNTGSDTLVILVMGQRLAQDVADYPDKGKRLYRNSGVWEMVDLSDIQSISPTLAYKKTD